MLSVDQQPLVSIITPVYNGQTYLAQCIESVIKQTYQNWRYTIVNNCSTDRTLEIASRYARQDSRIRVHNNATFLPLIKNWNHAMRQTDPESKYCKVVHADDRLFPACIAHMVDVAERHPSTGLVGSYILLDTEIRCTGIPYPKELVSGKEICRAAFKGDYTVFGPPTVLLVRSELISRKKPFYDENYFFADAEVCFRVLQDWDFGFVHQILSFVRLHEQSQTSTVTHRVDPIRFQFIRLLKQYGRIFFDDAAYRQILEKRYLRYYRYLIRQRLAGRKTLWDYQLRAMEKEGETLDKKRLFKALMAEAGSVVLNLQQSVETIKRLRSLS